MAAMAVDLTIKHSGDHDSNNNISNNENTAVDLSLPKECIANNNLDIKTNTNNSDNTVDILKRLMKASGSDITEGDKSQIELTALNLLCLARLQEMLTRGPDGRHPLPAHLLQTQLGYSSTPWNRKMYKCDYEGCEKVRLFPLNYKSTTALECFFCFEP